MSIEQVSKSIESGRQVGKRFTFEDENGQRCWSSVAVQKWKGLYIVVIDEIPEEEMGGMVYTKDIYVKLNSLDEVISFVKGNSHTELNELGPLKGRKIFDPFDTET